MEMLPANIECALRQFRQAASYMDTPMVNLLPGDVQPLLQLLQIQTMMIEAFASKMFLQTDQPSSNNSAINISVDDHEDLCKSLGKDAGCMDQNTATLEHDTSSADWFPSPTSEYSTSPIRRGSPCYSRGQRLTLRSPTRSAGNHAPQPKQIFELPATCSPSSLPSYYASTPANTYSYSPTHCTTPDSTTTSNSRDDEYSCATCDGKPWNYTSRPTPYELDTLHESRVQKVTYSLTTSTKPQPITPSSYCGTITLHSSSYRQNYHCVHDRPDLQCLLAYSHSPTWESDFPGIPPPRIELGEVAMELLVYPDCLLIVTPFKVPRYAGLEWYTLDAIGVGNGTGSGREHARPTSVQVMFLGQGYLKLRIGLSELLGWDRLVEKGLGESVVEFVGCVAGV